MGLLNQARQTGMGALNQARQQGMNAFGQVQSMGQQGLQQVCTAFFPSFSFFIMLNVELSLWKLIPCL